MQVQVLTVGPFDQTFTYEYDENSVSLSLGQVVLVPLGRRLVWGVVWSTDPLSEFAGPLKSIHTVSLFILPAQSVRFIQWVANYTLIPLGMVLKMVLALPGGEFSKILKKPQVMAKPLYTFDHTVQLSEDQHQASQSVAASFGSFQPFVLDGVTGSGKTEVYLDAIEQVLQNQGQVLVLLPEISLTTQWLDRFKRRFHGPPVLWHSGVALKDKRQAWQQVIMGHACVVVGARSALFLPFKNLHLIIIDEEHDDSYKQHEQSHYHARDMAVVRAQLSHIPIVLASATPSLETIYNIQRGKYRHLQLKERFANAMLPAVNIIDMKKQPRDTWISEALKEAIKSCLAKKEQVLLFLNRRGYAPLTLCRGCGHRFMCPACSVWLVQHTQGQAINLRCHHCGFQHPLPPLCPSCQEQNTFVACGPGVERVAEEARKTFPHAQTLIVTSDHLSSTQTLTALMTTIHNKQADIIIGTQVLAKGHHFPFLTLVGIIDADLGLNGGDLRAGERTYQILHQVSGRAGREQRQGKVLLQTYHPDHPLFLAIQGNRRDDFYACELAQRQEQHFPPYGFLASVLITGFDPQSLESYVRACARLVPAVSDVVVLGPVPAPVTRLRGRYRWRFLLKAERALVLQPFLRNWLSHPHLLKATGSIRVAIDIDPYSFL